MTEEVGATPAPEGIQAKAARPFIEAARRNLSEKEAASPAGIRWLAYDVERLDGEWTEARRELKELRQKFDALKDELNDKCVELERANGAARISFQNEILTYLCATGGAAGLGASASFLTVPTAFPLAIVGLIVSAILVIGGIVLRVLK